MSSTLSYLCPARSWSNASEFNEWLYDQAKNEQKRDCPKKPLNDQNLGFDTYILAHPKHASLSRCLCGSKGAHPAGCIRLSEGLYEVPLQWSEGKYTATQIVEGKRKHEIMRTQKMVLCQVEDDTNRWFEVAVLNNDLSYPFDCELIGLQAFQYLDYPSARRRYKSEVATATAKTRKEVA